MFDKFTFTALSKPSDFYTASRQEQGYLITWVTDPEGILYTFEDVEYLIKNKTWVGVKEIKQPLFSIKEGSIESAARFIVANNNYKPYANIKECEDDIKRYIRRMIEQIKSGEESYILSTAGWTILIVLEDEDYYVVEVLVDTLVSQDREFVNVEEII